MDRPNCCWWPSWTEVRDLDSARGFDLTLGQCKRCGEYSMKVFCTASSMGDHEAVSAADAERMKSTPPAELKALMKEWVAANIDPGTARR